MLKQKSDQLKFYFSSPARLSTVTKNVSLKKMHNANIVVPFGKENIHEAIAKYRKIKMASKWWNLSICGAKIKKNIQT